MHESDLTKTKKLFEQWRQGKKHGDRIPENLWNEACRCAQLLGASRVCAALGVNWQQLKEAQERQSLQPVESKISQVSEVPVDKQVKERQRVTVTKIVSLESREAQVAELGHWDVVSPDGWRFSGRGTGSEVALRVFVETVSRCGVEK